MQDRANRGPRTRPSSALGAARLLISLSLGACAPADAGSRGPRRPGQPICPETSYAFEAGPSAPDTVPCYRTDDRSADAESIQGTVFGEAGPGHPGVPLEGVVVTLHDGQRPPARPGPSFGEARTDMQGHFQISASLEPGEYMLAARSSTDDTPLAFSRFTVSELGPRVSRSITLWVPMDPRLKPAQP